jgi:hypothetical protein
VPLYTYLTTYKGASYVAQARRSNFRGFPDWIAEMPANALPGLTLALRKELNPYDGTFEEVPNRQHVWQKKLMIGGSELVVVVVQTED